jgi:protein SCO1/2
VTASSRNRGPAPMNDYEQGCDGESRMDKSRCKFLLLGLLVAWPLLASDAATAADNEKRYERTEHAYEVPAVTLLSQDRVQVRLDEFVDAEKPVFVDFIYGTCTTICPVLSAGYSNLQRKLAEGADQVRLVSISIDPEHDTPEVMKEYLERYRAQPGWDFFTGSRTDIDAVMRAFDAFVPDKMSHRPIMFLRAPGSGTWVRINGLIGSRDLMEEYEKLLEE